MFSRPRASPTCSSRGALAASPAFTFFSWSAGCVTSLHSLLRVESLLSLELWLCDVALEASCCCPHGNSMSHLLASSSRHRSRSLLWSALAEGRRVDAIVWLAISCFDCHVVLFASRMHILREVCSRRCFGCRLVVSPAHSAQSRQHSCGASLPFRAPCCAESDASAAKVMKIREDEHSKTGPDTIKLLRQQLVSSCSGKQFMTRSR